VISAGVIGVGAMGRQHARVYTEIEGVELVAIADLDAARRDEIARRYKIAAYADYREMLEREGPDVVSVAVPTQLHYQVALDVIERGMHLLIEKPIASKVEEAKDIIRRADERGLKLAVGHVERFNPAVIELKKRLEGEELGGVFLAHARRLGPFPERVHDMGVIIDLATHDLDVMCHLLGSEVERVYAETTRRIHSQYEDLLSGLLRFKSGAIGVLDVNRLTPTKIRELTLTGRRGMFVVNYLSQDLYFYENDYATGAWESLGIPKGVGEGNMIRLRIQRKEPLRVELEAFVNAVINDERPPVGGKDGLRALVLARQLVESGASKKVVEIGEHL